MSWNTLLPTVNSKSTSDAKEPSSKAFNRQLWFQMLMSFSNPGHLKEWCKNHKLWSENASRTMVGLPAFPVWEPALPGHRAILQEHVHAVQTPNHSCNNMLFFMNGGDSSCIWTQHRPCKNTLQLYICWNNTTELEMAHSCCSDTHLNVASPERH